ncbi:hypothetical protein AVEN_126803-1 [Araneus ventricosus]|uniref:Uncharacterized protein n=1 Tax=Araneus ventricosus TaxID=182803 RepID=A0A4Y2C697_ARAVE|nr:hypothetical protein AVEN_228467-1 [Araneus ventricosus]GBL99315.1 hypothetical protein AVEN_126803-1 [Araneus ventricosus]
MSNLLQACRFAEQDCCKLKLLSGLFPSYYIRYKFLSLFCLMGPWWRSGKVPTPGPEDSRLETRLYCKSVVYMGPLQAKSYVGGQTSSRWRGVEVWRGTASSAVVFDI